MPSRIRVRPWGSDLSSIEKMSTFARLLPLPFAAMTSLALSLFLPDSKCKNKPWKRVIVDAATRYLLASLSSKQIRYLAGGSSLVVYKSWAKGQRLGVVVDEIGEGARLLWTGARRFDKVILYLHGGAFLVPMNTNQLSFWHHVQRELKRKGIDSGIVSLNYTLIPDANFPTQLRQTVLALQYILTKGATPENIILAGDSAGGNLVLQLLAHILHPVNGVPHLSMPRRLGGIYLMSPWVALTADTGSHAENAHYDILVPSQMRMFGAQVLASAPPFYRPYMEANHAPDGWFAGADNVVDRVLVSAGGVECLRDDIALLAARLAKVHPDTKYVVQEGGVHDDPILDFPPFNDMLSRGGTLMPVIIAWLANALA